MGNAPGKPPLHMRWSLARKTVLAATIGLLVMVGATLLVGRYIVLQSFLELEERLADASAKRLASALAGDQAKLSAIAGDYANREALALNLERRNAEFVSNTFSVESLANLQVDFVLLLLPGGEVLWAGVPGGEALVPPPAALVARLRQVPALFVHDRPDGSTAGLVRTSAGPLLVASRPITTTFRPGERFGTFVIGRYLDDAEIARLAADTHLGVDVAVVGAAARPGWAELPALAPRLAAATAPVVQPRGAVVSSYLLLHDLDGAPYLIARTTEPREVFERGLETVRLMVQLRVALSAAGVAVILWLLRVIVVARMAALARTARDVGSAGDHSRRVQVSGSDEITQLGHALNEMLASLEAAEASRQEALRASERRYRALVEHAPVAVLIHDGRDIVFANSAAARLLGGPAEGIVGRPVATIVPEGGAAGDRCMDLTGHPLDVEIARGVLEGHDDLHQLVLHDVRGRKALERQMLMNDRLAIAGTLAAGVAHEINNPLGFLTANLIYVLDELERGNERLGDEARAALQDAHTGSQRVATIVRDMRVFSRGDERTVGAVDLGAIVETTLRMLRRKVLGRATVDVQIAPDLVRGNEAQLGQVLVNLVINALQAFPDRPEEQDRLTISSRRVGAELVIEVRDNGPGIPAEVLPRIFDPFFTTKPVGLGTGLGLSICHGIVASLDGQLTVESTPGQGACFRITLAVAAERRWPRSRTPVPQGADERPRVLVIDDDPLTRRSIQRLLRDHCDVQEAADGSSALIRVAEEHFDVVLCDVMMPGMTGIQVFEEVRRSSPQLLPHMGFVTAGAISPAAQTFLDGQRHRLLAKPIERAALESLVRRLVDGLAEAA